MCIYIPYITDIISVIGNRLLKAMDKKTNPCKDFYQFSCGRWIHEHSPIGDELETSRFLEARQSLYMDIGGKNSVQSIKKSQKLNSYYIIYYE